MAISSNKGEIEIKGRVSDILADLSCLIYALKTDVKISRDLIEHSVRVGLNYREDDTINDSMTKKILKLLGLED